MSRSVKKFLYALLYLGVFSLIGFVIYVAGRSGRERSSSDILTLPPLVEGSDLQIVQTEIFRLREVPSTFLFGRVKNASADFGFRFLYVFSLYDKGDKLIAEIENEANASPSSETIFSDIVQHVLSRNVYRILLTVREPQTVPAHEFPLASFSFASEPGIEVLEEERIMRVRGSFRNESGTFIPEARAVAVLRDEFGFQIFVTETTVLNIRSFSEKSFEIPLPYDADLVRRLSKGSAEVSVYPVF